MNYNILSFFRKIAVYFVREKFIGVELNLSVEENMILDNNQSVACHAPALFIESVS